MKIVHASISENNDSGRNGLAKAGDQTTKEVCVRDWYNKPWNIMLRYKDKEIAKKASEIAVKLANSNLVGYDQNGRNTLYQALKKYNWDVDAYIASGELTETDCSEFMYVVYCCLIPEMRSDGNAPTTSTMKNFFKKFGFTCYVASKYLSSSDNLRAGDVLVKEGSHTVMACDNIPVKSVEKKTSVEPDKYDRVLIGNYKTTGDLNIRNGAGTDYRILGVLPKGTVVNCNGYYSYSGNRKWYHVTVTIKNTKYTGYVSSLYLMRI